MVATTEGSEAGMNQATETRWIPHLFPYYIKEREIPDTEIITEPIVSSLKPDPLPLTTSGVQLAPRAPYSYPQSKVSAGIQ